MRNKLLMALAVLALVGSLGLTSCGKVTQGSFNIVFSDTTASKALGVKSITSGKLGSGDYFAFDFNSDSDAGNVNLQNSDSGAQAVFSIYRTDLGPGVSDGTPSPDGTSYHMFAIKVGNGVSTSTTLKSLGPTPKGTYDEAIIRVGSGASSSADYSPRFVISEGSVTTTYSVSSSPVSLRFFSASSGASTTYIPGGMTYILFVPSKSGVTKSTGIFSVSSSTLATDIEAGITANGDTPNATYWSGYANRYANLINSSCNIEIIPISGAFDFGDGSSSVAARFEFDPTTATYAYSSSTGVTTLDVTGTPPISATFTVQ